MSLGLGQTGHGLLGAVIEQPDSDAVVLSGRLSVSLQPWLADHVVGGVVVLAGAGLVELVIRAGDEVGCGLVEELVLAAPLVIAPGAAVAVQVSVGEAGQSGRRSVLVYSRQETPGASWVLHAQGTLAERSAQPGADLSVWPPVGAQKMDIAGVYQWLAGQGYEYGPAFQGLVGLWRRGEEVFAEVAVGPQVQVGGWGIHPVLLDAALHAAVIARGDLESQPMMVPYCWQQVCLHSGGATAARVQIRPVGDQSLALELADAAGVPVLSVGALLTRAVSPDQLRQALQDKASGAQLLELVWTPISLAATSIGSSVVVDWNEFSGQHSADVVVWQWSTPPRASVVQQAYAGTHAALAVLQAWLADERDAVLVIHTSGAIADGDGAITDTAAGAIWGLVRSAQTEHPGRIVLIDTDAPVDIPALIATGEPQLMVRHDNVYAARLARVKTAATPPDSATNTHAELPAGTVLITGGTGMVGAALARHLVAGHHVKQLVLVSRHGQHTPATTELVAELNDQGVPVLIHPCDVADPHAVTTLIDHIGQHCPPLTGIIHAAGTLDDTLITSLTPQRLDTVLKAKVDGAWNLHQATEHLDLSMFVLCSSIAAVLGTPAQANYAAANAFLDALATTRHHHGLPALSLQWGLWQQPSALTQHLQHTDLTRLNQLGLHPLTTPQATTLFDTALHTNHPTLIATNLDHHTLTTTTQHTPLPPLFHQLTPPPP
ncbi:type I polyketide synthase, partial [Mycobacterium szulgai]|uniref:type I polyketide synthase n=1 Tax=Mycobacterium szulgai TaxID=1787 RepID=UPI0021F35EB7